MKKKQLFWILPLCALVLVLGAFTTYTILRAKEPAPKPLLQEQSAHFASVLEQKYPEHLVRPLPYPVTEAKLFLYAKAGIIIDAKTGCVLFEKNADMLIPPASMTKVALMYVVFEAINRGETTLDSVVTLVPAALSRNAPPQSSVMGLEQNHIVTVRELLLGLCVASGNDAATALAYHISGSVAAFCARMNQEMAHLGLKQTSFVDASGYSELNMTTPKEFAALARAYITRYPEALKEYHSASTLVFPTRKNYAQDYTGQINTRTMYATNKLLNSIEGCDGLKTGFIYESGYNISLTAERNGTRFISVTMGGPGIGSAEGNKYRIADGKTLMDFAFNSFETAPAQKRINLPVAVWQGKENSLYAVEAQSHALTVPNIAPNAAKNITRRVIITEGITAPVNIGDTLGKVQYLANGTVLEEIPLVADRNIEEGSWLKKVADSLVRKILSHK